jgi:hypothetical protein
MSFDAAGSGGPIIDFGATKGGDDVAAARADAFDANCAGAGDAWSDFAATSARGLSGGGGFGAGALATGATAGGGAWLGGELVC